MLQGGASNRNIAASSFGTDGFVFLLRYSAEPTTKSLIRHTCRHAYTLFHNYYIKLCVGAACAGFISFLLHFDFTKTLDRAPYRKNACVFESGFLELYLFDYALQLEAEKSPSTLKEALQNRCKTLSKIVEKPRLASTTRMPQRPRLRERVRYSRHLTPKLLKTTQNYY